MANIGIDAQTTLGNKTGFGFYVKNLIEYLNIIDTENAYFYFKPENQTDLSTPQRFIWDQLTLPIRANRAGIDLFHQPCFSAPMLFKGKVVATICDLIGMLFGEDIPFWSRQYFGKWMPFSYRRADKIITISENTKKDVVRLLKIPAEKITVTHLAADKCFKPIRDGEEIQRIKNKYKTGGKYLLHVGTLHPRKNLEFLVKVFSRISSIFPEYNLVLTGKKGWYYEKLYNLINALGLKDNVVFTGYLPDEDAPCLYNGASVFLFPSLYEGFGLPPLEAMGCGIPVISSNTSSLPEVVGDAGILLSPKDEKAWVAAIKHLLENPAALSAMAEKSIKQAGKFSWDKCARETLAVYKSLIS